MTSFESKLTPTAALEKARKYCAYSDRCHFDMRMKLREWYIDEKTAEWIISSLIEEQFINEERFALNYSRGKLSQNGWGKNKIKYALRQKKISDYLVKKALSEISDETYFSVLKHEALKKASGLSLNNRQDFNKILQYLIQKGFESDISTQILNSLISEKDDL